MANIITLTGASHCGKSFIRNMFLQEATDDFKPVLFVKETTRPARSNDDDVKHVDKISDECDFVYEQYGVRYGFSFDKLYDHLKKGETPIIVVNDVRAVEDLRTAAGDQVISIFIYRRPPNLNEFENEERLRLKGTSEKEILMAKEAARIRRDKAVAIHRIYIENIYLFDSVILNITNEINKTRAQVKHIIGKMTKSIEGLK